MVFPGCMQHEYSTGLKKIKRLDIEVLRFFIHML